jgi:hypothetical protein
MNLQAHDLEAIAERHCITLANLWERQTGGPTWIWVRSPQLAMYEPWSKASVMRVNLVGQSTRVFPKGYVRLWHKQHIMQQAWAF